MGPITDAGFSGKGWDFISLPGLTLLLSILGAAIAGYLTYTHYDEKALVCTLSGCHTVQESAYSTIGPVPIAVLGLGMFLTTGLLAVARILDWSFIPADLALLATWTMTLVGVLYYIYLTYIEVFVLEAICQWCVASSIVALGIFAVESVGLKREFLSDTLEDA
jgi:uncharacterized membrane protein